MRSLIRSLLRGAGIVGVLVGVLVVVGVVALAGPSDDVAVQPATLARPSAETRSPTRAARPATATATPPTIAARATSTTTVRTTVPTTVAGTTTVAAPDRPRVTATLERAVATYPTTPTTTPPTTTPPTTTPAPAPPAPPQQVGRAEDEAIALTNAERAAAGLPPLAANAALTQAALAHAADQASTGVMSHTGSDGSDPGTRIARSGFSGSTWGENVAAGYATAASVVAGWMGSPGHRANILNPGFTQIGLASAVAADGTRFWTMALGG